MGDLVLVSGWASCFGEGMVGAIAFLRGVIWRSYFGVGGLGDLVFVIGWAIVFWVSGRSRFLGGNWAIAFI